MQFRTNLKYDKDAVVILVSKGLDVAIKDDALQKIVNDLRKRGQFSGEEGEIYPVNYRNKLVLLAGVGEKEKLTPTGLRIVVRRVLRSSFLSKLKQVELQPHTSDADITAIIEGVLIGTYQWKKYITGKKENIENGVFVVTAQKTACKDGEFVCHGVNLTRDLVNDNADVVDSVALETSIRSLIKGRKNVTVEVLNKKELQAKGLNLILAVNKGSSKEPKLMIVKYQGAGKYNAYTAVVGKGITFDTGGLNLKPTGHIESMRHDMAGAAAVIGTLSNVLDLKLKKNVLFVCAVAENAIGPGSCKPGDVYKSYAGPTVEIGNTDAEGRLVLADAIAYVSKNYRPKRIIDIATLTGACVVALGHDYSGLFTTHDGLAEKLAKSAAATDDRVWRMPLYPELKGCLKSKIADMRNMGFSKGVAGSITAAEFLGRFVGEKIEWAHIDIAGTAFVEGGERMYFGYGATGAGVRLLTDFLRNN